MDPFRGCSKSDFYALPRFNPLKIWFCLLPRHRARVKDSSFEQVLCCPDRINQLSSVRYADRPAVPSIVFKRAVVFAIQVAIPFAPPFSPLRQILNALGLL